MVYGDFSTGDLTLGQTQGTVSINSTLDVTGATELDTLLVQDNATLDNGLVVSGATAINGTATLSDTLDVAGATNLTSTLNVDGASTLASISASGQLNVLGATDLSSTLAVSGNATFSSLVTALSALSVSGELYIDGVALTNFNGDLYWDGSAVGGTNSGSFDVPYVYSGNNLAIGSSSLGNCPAAVEILPLAKGHYQT